MTERPTYADVDHALTLIRDELLDRRHGPHRIDLFAERLRPLHEALMRYFAEIDRPPHESH